MSKQERSSISPTNGTTSRKSTRSKIDRKAKKRGTRTANERRRKNDASTQTELTLTGRQPTSDVAAIAVAATAATTPPGADSALANYSDAAALPMQYDAIATTRQIINDLKCARTIEQALIRHLRYIFTNYSQPPLQPHAVIAGVNEAYAQLIDTAKQRGLSAVPAVVSEFFRELELIYPIGQLGEATKQAGLNPIDHLITEPIDELARNGQIPPQDSTALQALPSLATTDGLFNHAMPQYDSKYNTGQIERAALAGEGSGEFSLETDLTSTIAMSQ